MGKSNKKTEHQNPGWSKYQAMSDEIEADLDSWMAKDNSHSDIIKNLILRRRKDRNHSKSFKKFRKDQSLSINQRGYFEIGSGNYDLGHLDRLYRSRAQYLWENRWMRLRFGYYEIEYCIIDECAYSHYSLSDGMEFTLFLEMVIDSEDKAEILEVLPNLFRMTESHLYNLIAEESPPSYPY